MIKTVCSQKQKVKDAVKEIKKQLKGVKKIKTILYFVSSTYKQDELAKSMKKAFKNVTVFGCSTAGENIDGQINDNSLVVLALSEEVIEDIKIEVIENVNENAKEGIKAAFANFSSYYNMPVKNMDITKYVGLVLTDGLSGAEEKVMDSIGDMTDVLFVGGSAGDDTVFEKTYVHANGKVYSNATVLTLLKPKMNFDILKTQSFDVLEDKLVVTKADEKNRKVIEFNNKPAVKAYAEVVGCSVKEVEDYFMTNPVGLVVDDCPFVRSPQYVEGEDMYFYCEIQEGMNVSLLQSRDLVKDTKRDLQEKNFELGTVKNIELVIDFNCILRKTQLIKEDRLDEYATVFGNVPVIGFCTYGESYLGHINQTSTMLVFGS